MSDIFEPTDPLPEGDPFLAEEALGLPNTRKPPKFSHRSVSVYISWFLIILVTAGMFCLVLIQKSMKDDSQASQAEMMTVNSQAKMMLGSRELASVPAGNVDDLNLGSLEQRYGIVLLKNEISGAAKAEELLFEIDKLVEDQGYEPTAKQVELRKIVGRLLRRYKRQQWDTSSLPEADRQMLVDELGWVGELGLATKDAPNSSEREALIADATQSFVAYMFVFGIVICGGLLGIAALVVMVILVGNRKVVSKLDERRSRSAVYVETFAIWIVLFFVVTQFAIFFIDQFWKIEGTWARTFLQLGIFFGSLVVLVWPTLRGLTFDEVRSDIGWTCANPFKEIAAGFFSYLALAPLIGLQIIILIIVSSLTMQADAESLAPTGGGAHPIQDQIATGDISVWVGVFLLAVVAAPIVEETMFRGVFYRYLKDLSHYRRFWVSVVFASLVNGVIFAALHPQGLVGIPFLTTLAVGMSLARQWRDSLVASITMHAINNGLLTCLMFAIF